MFKRQRTGSVVCPSCGSLVGVNDEQCYTCGRRNPGLWGFAPVLRRMGNDLGFVPLIVYGCSALYVAGLLLTVMLGGSVMGGNMLGLLAPDPRVNFILGASGAQPVFAYGRWWTLLSAGWLHGGILHIVINMMSVRSLGPAMADIYGGSRMVIIYTAGSLAGFLLSSAAGAYLRIPFFGAHTITVGASAPLFGLLGALMYYGRRGGSTMIYTQARGYALAMIVYGLLFPGIDNAAHVGGFAGGYMAGVWLDPLKPERVNHMLGAVACLVLTALSIVLSVATIFLG